MYANLASNQRETTDSFFSTLLPLELITQNALAQCPIHPESKEIFWKDMGLNDSAVVYILYSLNSLLDSNKLREWKKTVVGLDTNATEVAKAASDKRARYAICKDNADALLLELGLFKRPQLRSPGYVDRGISYYSATATYRAELDFKRSAAVEVFEELAGQFGKYVALVKFMRHNHPNFFGMTPEITNLLIKELEQIAYLERWYGKSQ